ncbi:discoidin domain-containing protein, partial [Rhodoplanes elegans]|uniref:discoidin domain-containing protein n=1 Tax=Rhodoplanes elegans TaxID=29408 RepID=UPI00191379E2
AAPPTPPSAAAAGRGQDADIAYWNSVKDTGDPAQLKSYIAAFPNGTFVALATLRLQEIESRGGRPADDRSKVAALPPDGGVPPRPRSPRENCASFSAPAGTDLYCASSVLDPQFGSSYGVRNLFGGDPGSAWVEGAAGDGTGEWVTIAFDGERTVRGLVVNNGYEKSTDLYVKNGRVQMLRLVFSNGETRSVTLQDRLGPQTVTLDRPVRAHWVQLVIDRTYRGTRYTDTAISKLTVVSERAR